MKAYVFMSHRIHDKRPRKVICVQRPNGRQEFGRRAHIEGPSVVRFSQRGCLSVKTHTVKAWIEADSKHVRVSA